MKTLLLWAALVVCPLCTSSYAQTASVVLHSNADITGDGSAHALPITGLARWVQIVADPGNTATVRLGDSNTSSTQGIKVAAGGGYMFPPVNSASGETGVVGVKYDLSKIYYLAASGDKISIIWGN